MVPHMMLANLISLGCLKVHCTVQHNCRSFNLEDSLIHEMVLISTLDQLKF